MIKTDTSKGSSVKEMRAREAEKKAQEVKVKCEAWAEEKFTKEQVVKWSNHHKGLWFLPIVTEDGEIEKCLILRPINRNILSYASSKIEDEGLYTMLEAAMRECFVAGDEEILNEDEYFIPAAMRFNDIMNGKKALLLKR